MNTPSRILNLLNRQPSSTNELAKQLGISRNSTHVHVSKMESDGLVTAQIRSENVAGKPAKVYSVTPGAEDTYSRAHRPVLDALLSTINDELPPKVKINLLKKTGHAIAESASLTPTGNAEIDLKKAVDVVNELGANAEISSDKNQLYVTSYSCPIGSAVHAQPDTCKLVESFFDHATGKKVTSKCKLDNTLVCRFLVKI